MSANDTSQHGRKLSVNYLKHLLNVQDGGQYRIRNKNIHFYRRQPRILCINDSPKDWLKVVQGITDDHEVPLAKRLLFVKADELLVSAEAIARHEEDLEEIVREGKRRKMAYDLAHGIVVTATSTAPTTAITQAESISDSDFEPFEGGEEAPKTLPLPSEPVPNYDYTQMELELAKLREEVKRLQAENARLSVAAQSDNINSPECNPNPNLVSDADWEALQRRKFNETEEFQKPDLTSPAQLGRPIRRKGSRRKYKTRHVSPIST